MNEKLEVYEGKVFSVVLQSMLGSTPYGWCLKSLPEGIILMGCENVPAVPGREMGPLNQMFYLASYNAPGQQTLEIEFICTSMINVKDVKDTVKIELLVVLPADEKEEPAVEYSENRAAYRSGHEWPPINWPPINEQWPPINWPPINKR